MKRESEIRIIFISKLQLSSPNIVQALIIQSRQAIFE